VTRVVGAAWVTFAAISLTGCAGAPSEKADAADLPDLTSDGADLGTFPTGTALGPLMPQIVAVNPARVMAMPRVVPITWDNDSNRSAIESFFAEFAASAAWSQQVSEYGVGALTVGTPRHITGNAPTTASSASIVKILTDNLNGTWDQPDSHTIYEFFFPAGSKPGDSGYKCCVDLDAYHFYTKIQGIEVAYALICMCPGFQTRVTDFQELTVAASHETIEAATDPFLDGYVVADDAHAAFTYALVGELADMCNFADTVHWTPPDMTYMTQRTWSNAAARAGHDPCVGGPATQYYQTVPFLPDLVSVPIYGLYVSAQTINIPVGQTGKVAFTVFADDPSAGPFNVTLDDYASTWRGKNALLEITAPQGPFAAGDNFEASIKVLGQDPDLTQAEEIIITTTPTTGGVSTKYFAVIGQP